MAEPEYHVSSFVVRTRPEDGALAVAKLTELDGIEVHAEEDGRLIVTAEAGNVRRLAELASSIEEIETVMTVAPIYHEFSTERDAVQPESRDKH